MVADHDRSPIHERIDRSCDLLGSEYRRRVIYALQQNGPSTVGELADAVVSAGVADARKRVLTSLVHTHLPKLSDADVVEYGGPDDVVSLSDGVEALEPFLTVAARREAESGQLSPSEPIAPGVASPGPE
jgi:hypothetical protein